MARKTLGARENAKLRKRVGKVFKKIPLEILREIASYVATFKPLSKSDCSLGNLSQVSKDWRAACMPFRFRAINAVSKHNVLLSSFAHMTLMQDTLPLCLEELTVCLVRSPPPRKRDSKRNRRTNVNRCKAITGILSRAANLNTLVTTIRGRCVGNLVDTIMTYNGETLRKLDIATWDGTFYFEADFNVREAIRLITSLDNLEELRWPPSKEPEKSEHLTLKAIFSRPKLKNLYMSKPTILGREGLSILLNHKNHPQHFPVACAQSMECIRLKEWDECHKLTNVIPFFNLFPNITTLHIEGIPKTKEIPPDDFGFRKPDVNGIMKEEEFNLPKVKHLYLSDLGKKPRNPIAHTFALLAPLQPTHLSVEYWAAMNVNVTRAGFAERQGIFKNVTKFSPPKYPIECHWKDEKMKAIEEICKENNVEFDFKYPTPEQIKKHQTYGVWATQLGMLDDD